MDVDANVLTEFGSEADVVHELLQVLEPRIEDVVAFSEANRIELLKTADSIGVDSSLAALTFEIKMIDCSSEWHVPEHGLSSPAIWKTRSF